MIARFAFALALTVVSLGLASEVRAQACTSSAMCTGGRTCVDGQCCNTTCGGGVSTDCQACSIAAGAPTNGTCGTVSLGRVCRPDIGICDVEDVCNGITTTCGEEVVPRFPFPTVCRPAVTNCDVEEQCDGTNPVCPVDGFQPMGYLCRPPATPCDMLEYCPGDSVVCNPDIQMGDGTNCTPAVPEPCTILHRCMGGACRSAVGCVDTDICTEDSCNAMGMCVFTPMGDCDAGSLPFPDVGPRTDSGTMPPRDGGSTTMDAGSATCGDPICPCPRPPSACSLASDCGPSEVCVDGVCGEHTCVNAGSDCMVMSDCPSGTDCMAGVCVRPGGCTTMADCPAGMRCEPGPGGDSECVGVACTSSVTCPTGSVCEAGVCVEPRECVDERDCPLGYGCEPGTGAASVCIDRRPPCADSDECPFGFVCEIDGTRGGGFCRRVVIRCDSAESCQAGESCVDIDGDGLAECQPSGECATNADCAAGEVCGVSPTTERTQCGPYGPCDPMATGDCPSGESCVALDPGGVPECVLPGGSCADDTDCAEGQVCAITAPGAGPECFAGTDPAIGRMDAGVRFDAGPDRANVTGGGCVCRAGRGDVRAWAGSSAAALLVAALAARRRRRG